MTITTPPPPRPTASRSMTEPARSMNQPRTLTIRLRWDTLLTVAAATVVGFAAGVAVAAPLMLAAAPVNEDVPWCTAPIADAGGLCHGEPLDACVTEDSADCYWDASRGNRLGRSFVDVGGTVYYQDVTP